MTLTPKQQLFIDTLLEHVGQHGVSPTYQELAGALGISKVSVFETVEMLVRKGVISRKKGATRSLEVLESAMRRDGGKALVAAKEAVAEAKRHELPEALRAALARLEAALPIA